MKIGSISIVIGMSRPEQSTLKIPLSTMQEIPSIGEFGTPISFNYRGSSWQIKTVEGLHESL